MEAEDWNRRYEGPDLVWTARPNRLLVAEVGELSPGRALDLGCGEGRNAVWLATRGWSVTAVDFAGVGVDKGRRLAEAEAVSVEWVVADLRAYEPAADAYDLVIALYLHVPAPDRRTIHAAAVRSLRPGGTFLVVGHDLTNLADGHGGPQDPTILLTPDEVAEDLAGLAVVKAERALRQVSTEEGERTARDTVVRALRVGTTR